MPDFQRLPDGSLILRGTPAPPKSRLESLKAAIAGFIDAMRPAPKVQPYWLPPQDQAQAAPAPAPAQAAAPAAPGLPVYNSGPWGEIESKAQDRQRIVEQLGEFPQRMMASPLVEGRLF